MAPKLVSNMYDCMSEFQCHSSLDIWSSDASTGLRDTAVTPQVSTIAEAGAQFCGHIEPPNSSKKSHSGAHARANFSTNFNSPCLKLQMMF